MLISMVVVPRELFDVQKFKFDTIGIRNKVQQIWPFYVHPFITCMRREYLGTYIIKNKLQKYLFLLGIIFTFTEDESIYFKD